MRRIRYLDFLIGLTTLLLWPCYFTIICRDAGRPLDLSDRTSDVAILIGLANSLGGLGTCTGTNIGLRLQVILGFLLGCSWIWIALSQPYAAILLVFSVAPFSTAFYGHVRAQQLQAVYEESLEGPGAEPDEIGRLYRGKIAVAALAYLVGLGCTLWVLIEILGQASRNPVFYVRPDSLPAAVQSGDRRNVN